MGRKNSNATKSRRQRKFDIARNHHFMYSLDEFGNDATVVRYLGDQDGDYLYCYHPEGYALWIHLHHLWNAPKVAA